jgi:hypothetical protein
MALAVMVEGAQRSPFSPLFCCHIPKIKELGISVFCTSQNFSPYISPRYFLAKYYDSEPLRAL